MHFPLGSLLIFLYTQTVLSRLSLVILHMNDFNARFDEVYTKTNGLCVEKMRETGECVGGAARIATVVKEHRELHEKGIIPKVLFIFSGNAFTGSVWFRIHKQNITSDFINQLNPDVVGLGPREFHYGPEGLIPYIENTNVPFVCSNFEIGNIHQYRKIKKSLTIVVAGIKVGFLGYITPTVTINAHTGNLEFRDEIATLTEEAAKLKKEGVNIIIALGSASYEKHERVAEEIPDINIVLGGNERRFLWNANMGPPPENITIRGPYPDVVQQILTSALVITTPGLTRYLGRLNVTFDDNGNLIEYEGQPIFISPKIAKDAETEAILNKYKKEVNEAMDNKIADSKVMFKASKRFCRRRECNFGNIAADSMVDYVMNRFEMKFWSKSPIGLVNAGSMKSDIDPRITDDSITEASLMNAWPFDEAIVTASISGNHLKQVLEFSASLDEQEVFDEGTLQLSGVRMVIDRSRAIGNRISSLRVRCGECQVPTYQPIALHEVYNIVTLQRLLDGSHGHLILKQFHFGIEYLDIDSYPVLRDYLRNNSPVYPQLEGRIIFNNSQARSSARTSFLKPLASYFTCLYFLNFNLYLYRWMNKF